MKKSGWRRSAPLLFLSLVVVLVAGDLLVRATLAWAGSYAPWWLDSLLGAAVVSLLLAPVWFAALRHVAEPALDEAMESQQAHFRALIDNSPDITMLLAADGSILYQSRAFERILGYSAQDMHGRSAFALVWPEDVPEARVAFGRAAESPGVPVPFRHRLRHADGGARWIEGTGTNFIHDPAVAGTVINGRDVTAQREAQNRLEQLSRAVEQSPASIVITDSAGAIEYVNPAFCLRTGYSSDEVLGRNPRILKSGRLPDSHYQQLWKTIAAGRQWRGELHNRTRTGQTFWEDAIISGISDDGGSITHFVAVKQDITEQKKAIEELSASEARFHGAFDQAAIGMVVEGANGRWLKVNGALCTMLGYTADELLKMDFVDITHPDDVVVNLDYQRRIQAGEISTYEVEKRYMHKRGHEIWAQVNASIVMDKESESFFLLGQIQDITARRLDKEKLVRRASELAAANRKLLKAEAERLKAEAELRLAQKLETVGQLAAGIAHEINTPMQYVGDSVRFLKDSWRDLIRFHDALAPSSAISEAQGADGEERDLDAPDLDYLRERVPRAFDRTIEGVEQVASIVRAMKAFAHPDSKDRTATDVNEALANVLVVARNEYKYVADVETDFGPVPMIPCHAGEINQVFLNLIVNAAHAIGDAVRGTGHRGRIRVSTKATPHAVVIRVRDSGTGIPDAVKPRIFDPFFTTKPIGIGSGQGLALSRSIIKKHGGSLRFRTRLGQGTQFTIQLPLEADTSAGEEVAA